MTATNKLRKHPKPPTRSALARPTGSAYVSRCEISGKLLAEVLVMYGVVQVAAIDDPDGYDGYATMNRIHQAAKYLQDRNPPNEGVQPRRRTPLADTTG